MYYRLSLKMGFSTQILQGLEMPQSQIWPLPSSSSLSARWRHHPCIPVGTVRMTKKCLMISLPRQPGWHPMTSFDDDKVVQAEVDLKEEFADLKRQTQWQNELLLLPWVHSLDPSLRISTDLKTWLPLLWPPTTTVYWVWLTLSKIRPAVWPALASLRSGPSSLGPLLVL